MNPKYYPKILEFELALEAGVHNIPEIVRWADTIILNEEYDDDVASLSVATKYNTKELLDLISSFRAQGEKWDAMRIVLGRLHSTLTKYPTELARVCKYLDRFCIEHGYDLPSDLHFLVGLDDDYYLAWEGYTHSTIDSFRDELLKELEVFKSGITI